MIDRETKFFSTKNIGQGWDGTIKGNTTNHRRVRLSTKGSKEKGEIFLIGSFILIK